MRKSIVTAGLVGLSASLVLAGCSSSAESEVTPTVTPAPSKTTVVVAVLAQDACDDYFALDLVRSRIMVIRESSPRNRRRPFFVKYSPIQISWLFLLIQR